MTDDTEKDRSSRIKLDKLEQPERELNGEEAKQVKGGLTKVGAGTLPAKTEKATDTPPVDVNLLG